MDTLIRLQTAISKARGQEFPIPLLVEIADAAEAYIEQTNTENDDDIGKYLEALEDYEEDDKETVIGSSKLGVSPLQLSVTIDGVTYPSLMHCFQAHKEKYSKGYEGRSHEETDVLVLSKMKEYSTIQLQEANQKGRCLDLDIAAWDTERDNIMYNILSKSLEQDGYATLKLKNSTADIVEDMLPDEYWGGGGKNKMGKALMRLRDDINSRDAREKSNGKRKRM
jgi:predicted NAD-dependent protein-ADP-ribosyltransferase YbiA (DUF1768 family)